MRAAPSSEHPAAPRNRSQNAGPGPAAQDTRPREAGGSERRKPERRVEEPAMRRADGFSRRPRPTRCPSPTDQAHLRFELRGNISARASAQEEIVEHPAQSVTKDPNKISAKTQVISIPRYGVCVPGGIECVQTGKQFERTLSAGQ